MQKVTIDLYIKDGENEIKYLRNFLDFLKLKILKLKIKLKIQSFKILI
jgi:hypothetical protein